MKIIHCSDLHFDSPLSKNFTPKIAQQRNMEIFATFERLVKYASDNNIEHIILAGDIFDTEKISYKTEKKLKNLIENYKNINFYFLCGNHDINHEFLNSYENNYPSNLKPFCDNWKKYEINEFVNIIGIEIIQSNKLILYDYLKSNIDENKFNIVIMHGNLTENPNLNELNDINMKKMKNQNIDYLALGHIHSYKIEKLDQRGVYCYSGCLEGRGFDESGDKGFIELEINSDKKIKYKFTKWAHRTIHLIKWEIKNQDEFNWYNWVNEKIDELEKNENIFKKDIVRVEITGEIDNEIYTDIKDVEKKLNSLKENERFFYVDVKDSLTRTINYEKYKNDESLIGKFINKVKNDLELNENEKKKIIKLGCDALREKN